MIVLYYILKAFNNFTFKTGLYRNECLLHFSLRKRLSVSESSHTESDSSPPLTVRRRCCSAIIEMPRFAISTEEESIRKTPIRAQRSEELPSAIPELPVERELRLDESPITPGSTSSQATRGTLTRQCCLYRLLHVQYRSIHKGCAS